MHIQTPDWTPRCTWCDTLSGTPIRGPPGVNATEQGRSHAIAYLHLPHVLEEGEIDSVDSPELTMVELLTAATGWRRRGRCSRRRSSSRRQRDGGAEGAAPRGGAPHGGDGMEEQREVFTEKGFNGSARVFLILASELILIFALYRNGQSLGATPLFLSS